MSPTSHAYFDYELRSIDLEKVYSFEPVPEGLSQKEEQLIIGGECNMWTEHVPDEKALDAKVFPRLLAMSERFVVACRQARLDGIQKTGSENVSGARSPSGGLRRRIGSHELPGAARSSGVAYRTGGV